jgi:hypothetical protein
MPKIAWPLFAGVLALVATLSVHDSAAAQTADTVVLRSGNPVIGEIKSFRRGSLSFDTDEMDVVSIDWDDIAFLTSARFFEVHLSSGAEFYGSLAPADTAVLIVAGVSRADTVAFGDVVSIRPFDSGFFARTNGFVDLGTNIARANSLSSIFLNGQFTYRGPKWGFNVGGDFYRQRQETTDTAGQTTEQSTRRSSASLRGDRFLGAKWALNASGTVEENQELDLDARLLGSLGGQFQAVRNQGIELAVIAGGTINDEQFVGVPRNTTAELLIGGNFDMFDVGNLDVFTSLSTYTSAKDGGRIRVSFDARVAWEFISDFNLGFTVIERYDSQPPSPDAANRDFQYSLTFGWSWS